MDNKILYYLTINVTDRCNLFCSHCYASSGKCLEEDLNLYKIKKTLRDAKDLGLISVLITGGEPLLRKDIQGILEYSKSLGLKVFLATNGTLINKDNIIFIKRYVDKINISLDGTFGVHDKIRGKKGLFKDTIKKIRKIISEEIPLSISFTAQDNNYLQIEKLTGYLDKEDILKDISINIKRCIKMGRSAKNNVQLSKETYIKIIKIIRRIKDRNVRISFKDPFYSLNVGEDYRCYAGIHILSLKNNGDIWICTKVDKAIGNINQNSLKEIWDNSEILKQLRENSGKVTRGCRAAAFISSGDLLSRDPISNPDP